MLMTTPTTYRPKSFWTPRSIDGLASDFYGFWCQALSRPSDPKTRRDYGTVQRIYGRSSSRAAETYVAIILALMAPFPGRK